MCGLCHLTLLDKQAIVQTSLKLHVVYNTNTKLFYACDMKVNPSVNLRFLKHEAIGVSLSEPHTSESAV